MRKTTLLVGLIALLAMAFGCQKESKEAELTLKNASDANIAVAITGESKSVAFTSTKDWTVSTADNWLSVAPPSGKGGDASITIAAAANTTQEDRSGVVTINSEKKSLTITFTQSHAEAPASISLKNPEDANLSFTAEAAEKKVEFTTNKKWSAAVDADWIKIAPTEGGDGDGVITLTIGVNEDVTSGRTCKVTLTAEDKSVVITVNQEAAKIKPEITLKNEYDQVVNFNIESGIETVEFTSSLNWSASTECDWIKLDPAKGESGEASISIDVTGNDSGDLRKGTVVLTSEDLNVEILVIQTCSNATNVDVLNYWVDGIGGDFEVPILTKREYTVEVIDAPQWCTIKDKNAESIMVIVDFNSEYAYREASVVVKTDAVSDTILFAQGASVWTIDMNAFLEQSVKNNVALALFDGKLIVAAGNGGAAYTIDPMTGVVDGIFSPEGVEIGFLKNDDAGNLLICNHTAYDPNTALMDKNFKVWKMSSLTATPELIVDYAGYQPLGAKLSVRGDVNGKGLIVATYEGVEGITGSNEIVYWQIENGEVPEGTVAAITGFVGLGWLPGYWNIAPESAPAIASVSDDIKDGLLFSVYDENTVYFIDGTTFIGTSMMTPTGESWGQTYNTMSVRSYNGHTFMAMCPQPFWPEWGYIPQVLVFDVTDIPSIIAEHPVVTEASSLILNPGTYSFLQEGEAGVSTCGDVLMAFSNGMLQVCYIDHNNHTIEAFVIPMK